MAVKQNNTESNDGSTAADSAGTAGGVGGGSNVGGGSAGKQAKMNPGSMNNNNNNMNISDEGGGGESMDACSEQSRDQVGVGAMNSVQDIATLLQIMEHIDLEDPHTRLHSYKMVITNLARMQISSNPEDIKRFKEEMIKVGRLLATPNKKRYLMFYLRIVYELIQLHEKPSHAVAIVFELFSPDLIKEAVQVLLEQNVRDEAIRKTVNLLCEWIYLCNFCQNLNHWIMAILRGLREQERYQLLDNIALDNIERLFFFLVVPAHRHKVEPIVFHMLSTINQAPEIFHRLIVRIPKVISAIKAQSNSMDKSSNEIRVLIQNLVDLINALMLRFYDNDDLYADLKIALQEYEPSPNCVVLARAMFENALPRNARVGLVNLGNTCYMNSVLQALAMTSDFVRQILLIESGSLLLLKVQQQIALMHHSLRRELTPTRVLKATRPPGFTPGLQQDSSEFLGYLLDLLHEHEINSGAHMDVTEGSLGSKMVQASNVTGDDCVAAGVIPYNNKDHELIMTTTNTTTTTTRSLAPPTHNSQSKKPPSTIDKTFAGKLSTTYKCLSCAWESRNEDSFRELQLSFPDDKDDCGAQNYSVQDLIDYYCSPEKLDGDNQYFCARCKKLCDAERRIGITQAPRNLILTLKQFKYDQKYHFRTKLMHKVFHDESVVVKVCASDSLQETYTVHYDLYAGVVHAGYSMDSGHYFTFAADQSKNWFKFNDNLVTKSKPQEMHSLTSPNTPYILFYKMCGRSIETSPTEPTHPMIAEPPMPPLTLDELPRTLRDYVKQDNHEYDEEVKMERLKRNAKRNQVGDNGTITRNGYDGDDEDDHSPHGGGGNGGGAGGGGFGGGAAGGGGCGGNDLGMNINRFVC